MSLVTHLECGLTGEILPAGVLQSVSSAGKPLLVRYDTGVQRRAVQRRDIEQREATLWRWRELLPLPFDREPVSLGEVETPLVPLPATARAAGVARVDAKDEARLPTASFKARGLVMAVNMALAFGVRAMAIPTNGNAGAAMAAYCARAGIEAHCFAPSDTPEANLREIALFGAKLTVVDGMIDDCGKLVAQGEREGRWFNCATLREPYRIEGKKTMGLELALQLGWELPDAIFYPTGGGTGLIGMWKAFDELEALGWIGSRRPRLYAVQSEGCAPIVRAFEEGTQFAKRWENSATIAHGIRVPAALGDFLILRAVRETGGAALAVSERAIVDAWRDAARDDGFLMCPEGAATLAGLHLARERGLVAPHEHVVLFNCASGYKYRLPDISL
ncbi:MAG TPA: threonine synthase [Xanthomonadales bacterium]|nr:threonine synthase [Xanthomonadales bacterium]